MNAYTKVVQRLEQDFYVPDILLPTSTCLFILESPHVQELKYEAPVSGSSGSTMSKHIFGQEYAKLPLGRLVKKNADGRRDRQRLNAIGLLNVSNVPLQKLAYGETTFEEPMSHWFEAMSTVRTNNHSGKFNNQLAQDIQDHLSNSLRSKLLAFQNQPVTLIPCGRFAQKFVRLTDLRDPSWTVIENVPHPSYNSWDRAQYATTIGRVIDAVQQAATPFPNGYEAGSKSSN